MDPGAGIHFSVFVAEYEAIVDRAREVVAGFPPLLRGLAGPLLPELAGGNFSRIVALLPYWVDGPLDGLEPTTAAPAPPTRGGSGTLGLANLLGWWSYLLQDGLLDGELSRPELLPLSTALHVTAVWLLEHLLPGNQAFWDAFQRLSLTSAEAHCWEQRYHLLSLADQDRHLVGGDLDDLDRLANRSALLQLTVAGQFALRGHDQKHPLRQALVEALRQYAIARQIGDDLTDWVEDLRQGRLNYVSARITRRMRESGDIETWADLDADRVAGYTLYNDDILAAIQQMALDACQRASASIAPYDARYLDALIDELAAQLEDSFQAALESWRKFRDAFQPATGRWKSQR